MEDSQDYECYIARYQGKIVYIGSGVRGRHKHINSGKSHVVELNRMSLQGFVLDVEIIPKTNKYSALLHEEDLIREHQPVLNTAWTKLGKKDRELVVSEFMESVLEKPPEATEPTYVIKNEDKLDPNKLGLVFKEGKRWSSVIIKDVPVSYARLHEPHVAYWSRKLKYDVYVYSIVIYLSLQQLDYLKNICDFNLSRVDKVMDVGRRHCNLQDQPYAEGLYACRIERNALKYKGGGEFNKINVMTKTERGLVDRSFGIKNGTICSLKLIYMTGDTELYLDTVVVKS